MVNKKTKTLEDHKNTETPGPKSFDYSRQRQIRMYVQKSLLFIGANFIINLAFLLTGELFLWATISLITWNADNLLQRIPFVAFLLDGAQVLLIVGVLILFISTSARDLLLQFQILRKLEEKAGVDE